MGKRLVNKLMINIFIITIITIMLGFKADTKNLEVRSVFSWNYSEVIKGRSDLFKTMEKLNLNTVYQEFSEDLKLEDIESFLLEAEDRQIDVSLLTGASKWALDRDGKDMIHVVDRVIEINQKLEQSEGIKSIVLDVEPYTLKEWNEKSNKRIMNDFVRGMRMAYKKANDNNIEVIVCIPFYYDNMGLSKPLENLIKSGCDSIAIMNYFKTNESINIKNEVDLAHKYGKRVVNIYEMQAPGYHGLEEKNTYYNQGFEAVEESFAKIKEELPGKDISISFHEYNVIKEILERK